MIGATALEHSPALDAGQSKVAYERIAKNLGLTKQRIGQVGKDLGVDGRQREHERIYRREPHITRTTREAF